MKLQKIRALMIAIGFSWILCASILGSLIGAKINQIIAYDSHDPWLSGLEKTLFISTHSHLNLMGVITILLGTTLPLLWKQIQKKWLRFLVICNLISTPIFVSGLFAKACAYKQFFIFYTAIAATGASLFIISIFGFVSCFFLIFLSED